jgi:phage terminase small subunit
MAFIREYLIDLNAQQAAIRAGYAEDVNRECHRGANLLAMPHIAAVVKSELAKRSERVEIRQDVVLKEALRLATSDMRRAFKTDGTMKNVHDWPDDVAAFIASIKVNELYAGSGRERAQIGVIREVKLWPKVQALELLAKHLGILQAKVELTGPNGGPVQYENVTDKELVDKAREALAVLAAKDDDKDDGK